MKKISFILGLALLLAALSSCSRTAGESVADYSREIRINDPVSFVLFDGLTLKDSDKNLEAARKAISVSPKVDFDLQVMDAQTLCLIPREPLEYNSSYRVTADFGALAGAPSGKKSYEVKTLPPVIQYSWSRISCSGEDERYHVDLEVNSPEVLDGKYLESGFSAEGADVSVAWTHSEDGLSHTATVGGITATDRERSMELSFSWPRYDAEASRSYSLPVKDVFTVIDTEVFTDPCGYELAFSYPIDPRQDFSELVSMPGAGRLSFMVEGNVLRISPAIQAEGRQFISVSKAIRSAKGLKPSEDFECWFEIPAGEPRVSFISRGVVLPSSGGMDLSFQSVNYQKVRVRVKRIYESNVLQFLQNNRLGETYCYTGDVARVVLDTTLVLGEKASPRLRSLHSWGLDLAGLVSVQQGAIYRIEIKGEEPLAALPEDRYESDYYFGSYADYADRVRNVLVSDLSVIAKGSDKGEYTVFVADIISAKPVSGAKVALYNSVNQVIAEGSTGQGGRYSCSVPDDQATTVVVSKGSDKSYVSLKPGTAISMSNFEVDGTASRNGQKGYIFGERGVWRPGDDIHITFISMLDEGVLPAGHPVTATLSNPQGQVVRTAVSNNGCDGMYAFTFSTPSDAPTGNWEAAVTAGGQTWYKTVKIETVKPNNIVIDLKLNDSPVIPAGDIQGELSARWLVGNPAGELEARVDMDLSRGKTAFEGYKDYVFEDASRSFSSQEVELWKGRTDAAGKASFRTAYSAKGGLPGFMNARFTTRVFEKSGDFSIDRCVATLSPYSTYIGLSVPLQEDDWGEKYLEKGRSHSFRLAAVDGRGRPVKGSVKVNVEIYQMGWNWWWSSSAEGLASYAKDSYNKPYKELSVTLTDGAGDFRMEFPGEESGFWFFRITDPKGGHATSAVALVRDAWEQSGDNDADAAIRLPMTLDKEKYEVGQTARLVIPSAPGARALVSVEKGERVLKSFWVESQGEKTEISIPIESGMAPNVYATVSLVQPYASSENDAPIRLFGVQRILVEEAATHLHPVVGIADEIRPEQEVSFTVSEKDGRPMSYVVALVDEGLLSLTRYQTPDPWKNFYAVEALGVRTWDLYDLVIGAYGARMEQLFAIGGDGEGEMVVPNTQADRFKPVSMFLGPFKLKAREKGRHTVQIPQYIGQLRAMVVATDGAAMGSSDKSVSVTKPVMVKATLPRVLGTDEEVVLPVTVMANKDGVGRVTVEVKAEGALSVDGSATAVAELPKAGEKLVYFRLKASGTTGVGKLSAVARAAGESSEEDLEIDVRESNPRVTNSLVRLIDGGASVKLPFSLAGRPGTNSVSVEASTIPPVDLDFRLGYLTGYPHGCLEQTVSAAFPQLWLGELVDLDRAGVSSAGDRVKAALERLSAFTIPGGGMTTWPGTSSWSGADVWATVYATHFMVEAQSSGFAVPAALKKTNLAYLKEVSGSREYDAESRAYALYVLALAGSPDRSGMNRMREDAAQLPGSARTLLAGAYALDGKKQAARDLLQGAASVNDGDYRFSRNYDSPERRQAIAALVYSRVGERTEAFRCVERLSAWLGDRGHFMSTQSTAWALHAVADYQKRNSSDGLDLSVRTASGSSLLKSAKAIASGSLPAGDGTSLELEVTNSSKAPAYLVVSSNGVPEKGHEAARADGLRMDVSYTLPDGSPVDPASLAQGTDFVVTVRLTNLSATVDYTGLALTEIFPSGWEIRIDRTDGLYQDYRDDRVCSYLSLGRGATAQVRTRVTAAYQGRFYLPAISCEAMYDNSVGAASPGRWCEVR